MKTVYSTAEVANLLSINDSTVKRWSDSGNLECIRTMGRHRRFTLSSIMKFVQENKLQMPELAARIFDRPQLHAQLLVGNNDPLTDEIRNAALEGDAETVTVAMRIGLTSKPDLLEFFSTVVFPPLVRIGDDWANGVVSIEEEHLASRTIREALIRVQSELHYEESNGHVAVCAGAEGELHEIALDCVAAYLTVQGWTVYNFGADTPSVNLAKGIARREPDLVILSGVIIPDEWKFRNDIATIIEPAVRRAGGKLCIGGPNLRKRFGRKLKADFTVESIEEIAAVSDAMHFPAPLPSK
ncbi:MAG: helix-turn-helix domain-containing protein [Bacteroidota bacterium]